MTITHVYAADILKAERNEDGDLVVFGKATGPDLDLDKQVCDPDWLKTAMPAWMAYGNIREQHSSLAAGVATDLEQDGDSWMVRSVVVDASSARKVEKGVLKGYSIGIKSPRIVKDAAAPGGRIVGGEIVEVSLVDRPCNPTCTLTVAKAASPGMQVDAADFDEATNLVRVEEFHEEADPAEVTKSVDAETVLEPAVAEPVDVPAPVEVVEVETPEVADDDLGARIDLAVEAALAKRAFTQDQRDQAAEAGQAMKDGSFPIKSVADLKNALKALGRAKDPAAAKKHIMQRAKALGRTDLLPDGWKGADPDLVKADGEWVHDPAELAAVRDGLISVMKAELDEFATGDDERCDLSQLLCALSMYLDWWSHEAAEGETTSPFGTQDGAANMPQDAVIQVGLSAEADATKSSPGLSEDRVQELIEAAVTKASTASTKRIDVLAAENKALEAELAKVKDTPIPGGPVLTRTAADTNKAAVKDEWLAKAAHFRAQADLVADRQAKTGYWQLAEQAEAKADAAS